MDRYVSGLTSAKTTAEEKYNNLHETMMRQAADDALTLKQTPRGDSGPPVRYIEYVSRLRFADIC